MNHQQQNSKVLIIGAGPAGLSCAYELVKQGVEVEVFESSERVGGMSGSFDLWGQRVDIGPHRFFSKEQHVNQFFKEVVGDDFTLVNRLTRIYYRNRFFQYPLKVGNVLGNLPLGTISRILWDYGMQRIRPIKNPETFEDWVTNRFGKKLFEIFFKSYSEKLWGIPCSKIDADWAAQRIKTLSLFQAILFAIKENRGKHKTLVDQFAYPNNGTGQLYEQCAQKIIAKGGEIHFGKRVKQVLTEGKNTTGVLLENGDKILADVVVSTMPVTNLVGGLQPSEEVKKAVGELYYRNTILVYLEIDGKNLFEDNWIYVHSNDVKHGRITNFRNWTPQLNRGCETTILCMEYWSFEQEELWKMTDEELASLARKEIKKLGLIPPNMGVLKHHVLRIPKCYPVYETGYQEHLKVVEQFLDGHKNLIPIGRYGAFKYNNQDHSILMGILAAQNILGTEKVNLWDINTDVEYQEEGKIKDILIQ